jgi:hypothetical protein
MSNQLTIEVYNNIASGAPPIQVIETEISSSSIFVQPLEDVAPINVQVYERTTSGTFPIQVIESEFTGVPIFVEVQEDYAPVQSVNGKIGWVVIDKSDVGLSDVENVSIINTSGYLQNEIDNITGVDLSAYVTKSSGTFTNRPTVNGTGVLLSGEAAGLPTTIVYTTGNQTISGTKNFATRPQVNNIGVVISGEAYPSNNPSGYITGVNYNKLYFSITGSNSLINGNFTLVQIHESSRFIYTLLGYGYGDDRRIATWSTPNNRWELRAYQPNNNFTLLYFNTGASIYPPQTGWTANAGVTEPAPIIVYDSPLTAEDTFSLLITEDFRLEERINNTSSLVPQGGAYPLNNPSGFITGVNLSSYATIVNLNDVSGNLQTQINNISGGGSGVTGDYYPNSNPSGFITNANVVYTTGDQTISGLKTFVKRPQVNGTGVLLSGEAAGSANFRYLPVTGNTNLISNNRYSFDTLNKSITGTLPLNPEIGDEIELYDSAGTWSFSPLIINNNENYIEQTKDMLQCNVSNGLIKLIYTTDNNIGWRIYPMPIHNI